MLLPTYTPNVRAIGQIMAFTSNTVYSRGFVDTLTYGFNFKGDVK